VKEFKLTDELNFGKEAKNLVNEPSLKSGGKLVCGEEVNI